MYEYKHCMVSDQYGESWATHFAAVVQMHTDCLLVHCSTVSKQPVCDKCVGVGGDSAQRRGYARRTRAVCSGSVQCLYIGSLLGTATGIRILIIHIT